LSDEAGRPGGLRERDSEPNFAEPWQAQVMAIAANLVDGGHFTAAQWSEGLADEIRRAKAAGEPDNADSYYLCALVTLEQLAKSRGILKTGELAETKQAWIDAYERTPHGQPVSLGEKTST
jgi:nitrile hydratase accessory protein